MTTRSSINVNALELPETRRGLEGVYGMGRLQVQLAMVGRVFSILAP
jgi:hypothetical protein